MKYIEVITEASSHSVIVATADKVKAIDIRFGPVDDDGMRTARLVVRDDRVQELLDTLQTLLGAQPTARILVLPTELVLPVPETPVQAPEDKAQETREGLRAKAINYARVDYDSVALLLLSALVAALGLITNNVAVVIGAMVIAPLLGPNLALAIGTAMGELDLMHRALKVLGIGIGLAVICALIIASLWPDQIAIGPELLSRTLFGFDAVVLALASGAAAVLSLLTGLPSVLVGVMVAVALLPPAVTAGLMLGMAQFEGSLNALLLLASNIICINLAANLTFLLKGIHPRQGVQAERARKVVGVYLSAWVSMLAALLAVLLLRHFS